MDLSGTFGEHVRIRREFMKLTSTAAAERVGVSKAFWSDIEHGRRLPSDDVAERMRETLGADPAAWTLLLARERIGTDLYERVAKIVTAMERQRIRHAVNEQQERFREADAKNGRPSRRAEALSSIYPIIEPLASEVTA